MWTAIMPSAPIDLGMGIFATMHQQRIASSCTMQLRVRLPSQHYVVFALAVVVFIVE
jgi:hypothetical protein